MTTTTNVTAPAANAESRPSAEVIPFPIRRTETGRFIAAEYARRPVKGRYTKAAYADGVLKMTAERLQRLNVSQERIDAEIASLESMFSALSRPYAPKKVRA
jgi:hypothetical protein